MGKILPMKNIQKILGAHIRVLREQQKISQGSLALKAGISYQYLSGVETGKENFTVQVLESLATALSIPVKTLVVGAYDGESGASPPRLESKYFRHQVPLPEAINASHIEKAANSTQAIIHRVNRTLQLEVGQNLQSLIQGNNFSGLVSNLFSNAMDECSPYKHNHDQRYPDLIYKQGNGDSGVGLEVKTTINVGKGGESHNGHSGWHIIACYSFLESGDIKFVHIMFANLLGHQEEGSDWKYVGSKVNTTTGSRRTETYNTTLKGTILFSYDSFVEESRVVG